MGKILEIVQNKQTSKCLPPIVLISLNKILVLLIKYNLYYLLLIHNLQYISVIPISRIPVMFSAKRCR